MADDITLKMNVDITDAQSAINLFQKTAEKAFKSSNTSTQSMGNSLTKTANNVQSLVNKMKALENAKIPTQQYTNLQNKIAEVGAKATTAKKELEQMSKTRPLTDKYAGVSTKLEEVTKQLNKAKTELGRMNALGTTGGADWIKAKNDVAKYQQQVNYLQHALTGLETTGQKYAQNPAYDKQAQKVQIYENVLKSAQQQLQIMQTTGSGFTSGMNTVEYQKLAQQLAYAVNQGALLNQKINDSGNSAKNLVSTFKSFGTTISKAVSTTTHALSRLGTSSHSTSSLHNKSWKSMLTTVLKYGFGIRSIFLLYRKYRQVIKTGLTEMAKEFEDVRADVDGLKNSWSGFKASLVSAFQPIFSYVVPALTTLINYLTSAMNALANFFALLTGQGYYYKAKKGNESVANAISGTGSAAEDANEELAEYDDLLVIDTDDSSGGGGGGGGSSSSDAWNWEKVDVTASNLADKLSDMWDVFKKAWENKGQAVIDSAKTAFNNLKSLITTIAQTIYDVFVSGTGQTWVESVLDVFTSILTTIGSIASAWEKAWKKDGNGYKLIESIFNMFTSINNIISTIQTSWSNAWNSNDTGVAIIEDILQSVTNINNTIKNIATNFTEAWKQAGVGDSIMETILDTVETITSWIEEITSATADWANELDFYPLLESIDGVLESVKGVIATILSIAKTIYTDCILPIAKRIAESTLPKFLDTLKTTLDSIKKILNLIPWSTISKVVAEVVGSGLDNGLSRINSLLKEIQPTLDLLNTGFKYLKEHWNEMSNTKLGSALSTVYGWLKKILAWYQNWTFSWDRIIPGAGKAIETINKVVSALEDLKDMFDGDTEYNGYGKAIWDGIQEGFSSGDWSQAVQGIWDTFVDAIKSIFGINSPAENCKPFGKYIFQGIIEGFKNAMSTFSWSNLATTLYDYFKDMKDNILGYGESTQDWSTSIGDVTSGTLGKAKEMTVKIKTKLSGDAKSKKDVDNLTDSFNKLTKETSKSTEAEYKSSVGGQLKTASDIDSWRIKFTNLKSAWTNESSTMSVKTGGQISKISDLDTWKTIMSNTAKEWSKSNAEATLNAKTNINTVEKVGISGLLQKLTETANTWKATNPVSEFKTKFPSFGSGSDADKANKSKDDFAKNSWSKGATSSFTLKFPDMGAGSEAQKVKDQVGKLWDWWDGYTATMKFDLSFSANGSNVNGIKSAFKDLVSQINQAFKSAGVNATVSSSGVEKFLAAARGGIVNTPVIAGEAGKEAIIPLERNLGWMDKMATAITNKIVDMKLPDIVSGSLPTNPDFYRAEQEHNNNIENLLEAILVALSDRQDLPDVFVQLNGRTLAKAVADENDKRNKQLGLV